MMRAVGIGAALALVVVVAIVALVVSDVIDLGIGDEPPRRLLVIGLAPDEEGADVAAFAFVLDREAGSAMVLDTTQPVTVPNTSAESAREAYPFVGGAGVSDALAAQTGGEALPWLVMTPEVWSAALDEAGGVDVNVPEDVSVYEGTKLTILEPGERTLSGEETVALLKSLRYLDSQGSRSRIQRRVGASVSGILSADRAKLLPSGGASGVQSSLSARQLARFVDTRP